MRNPDKTPRKAYCTGCGIIFPKLHELINHRRTMRCGGRFLSPEETIHVYNLRRAREAVERELREVRRQAASRELNSPACLIQSLGGIVMNILRKQRKGEEDNVLPFDQPIPKPEMMPPGGPDWLRSLKMNDRFIARKKGLAKQVFLERFGFG